MTLDQKLDRIIWHLAVLSWQLSQEESEIMATLDDLTAQVTETTTVEQSAITLLTNLHDQLTAALATGDPAKVQTIIDTLKSDATALAAAVTANTPAAP